MPSALRCTVEFWNRHRDRYRSTGSALDLHIQQSEECQLKRQKRNLFESYIVLRDESTELLNGMNTKMRERALWSLVMEQIGVSIGYPALDKMQWSTDRDGMNPEQWIKDIQEVQDFVSRIKSEGRRLNDFWWFRWLCKNKKFKKFVRKVQDFVRIN